MNFRFKIYLLLQIIPFIFTKPEIKNQYGLVLSIILGKTDYSIKLKNNQWIELKNRPFETLLNLLMLLRLCTSYTTQGKKLIVSTDFKNEFLIDLENISYEDENLLSLLVWGTLHGGTIIDENDKTTMGNKQTLRVGELNGKKIVETWNGVRFYLDIFIGGVIECFVQDVHRMSDDEDWTDKIVVDVGASMGDTPLYYASMGARVYAFEIEKASFDDMIETIKLNPDLADKIIPVHAGIGKEGVIEYFKDPSNKCGLHKKVTMFQSRFVDDVNPIIEKAKGYSLMSAFKEFNITHIDFLKMDCKGCEFEHSSITQEVLQRVDSLKIEYMKLEESHDVGKLLDVLKKSGFTYRLYKHIATEIKSVKQAGNIYAKKII